MWRPAASSPRWPSSPPAGTTLRGGPPRKSSPVAGRPACATACGWRWRTRRRPSPTPVARRTGGGAARRCAARSYGRPASWTACCGRSGDCPRKGPAPPHCGVRWPRSSALPGRAGGRAAGGERRHRAPGPLLVRRASDEIDIVSAGLSRLRSLAQPRSGTHAEHARACACPLTEAPPADPKSGSARAHGPQAGADDESPACSVTDSLGVATSGFQIEGGFNGDGEPQNNWAGWEASGRTARSGMACDFWRHPEEALDRAAALGCNAFRLSVEWARLEPRPERYDDGRARALRRDPRSVRRPRHGPHRHAAPLHPSVVARRGALATPRIARRLARHVARVVPLLPPASPALGDDQRAEHRDAHGVDRGVVPAGPAHGGV